MIGPIIAAVGVPLLARLLGNALRRVDSPVAATAADALAAVDEAVAAGAIGEAELAEARRHLERMAEIESAESRAALAAINATMRAEVASEDAFVRRWRPFFGYCVAATWAVQMGALAWTFVATPAHAGEILGAIASLSVMWGIALSVLGVSVAKRSQDKAVAAGRPAPGSGLAHLMKRIAG